MLEAETAIDLQCFIFLLGCSCQLQVAEGWWCLISTEHRKAWQSFCISSGIFNFYWLFPGLPKWELLSVIISSLCSP